MRDDCVCIGQTGPNVIRLQIGIISEDSFVCLALSQQAQDKFNGNSHSSDNGFPTKDLLVCGDPPEELLFVHHPTKIPSLKAQLPVAYSNFLAYRASHRHLASAL